jgi:two-component system chemotaxis response regulator CheY
MAKILIVDDSSLSRRMLRAILAPAGYEIVEASDGFVALERYVLDRPDLVLLDLVMTGMDGFEVLEKIRQLDGEARVIVATADLQIFTRKMVETAGAKGLINKPYAPQTVLEAVSSALKGVAQ